MQEMVAEHTTGMVGSLPTELWISIVNHCQCSTLAALCQVSRLLYTVTLPRLYLDPFNSQFAYRRVQLEQSLAQHDHLAELVRTYRARPHQTTPAEILKKMTGLTHVSIRGRVPFLDFIQGYPPSNIRRLDLDVRIDTMDHQTAQIIAEWLATQREIVWLRWISRFEDTKQLSFLGAGLPKLRTLCTEASLAEFFLPGRSVSEFSCGCRSLAAEDIVTIAPLFTKDLRKLRLTLHQGALEMAMASLSNTCSKLTELHIQLGDHMTLQHLQTLFPLLSEFPFLVQVVMRNFNGQSMPPDSEEDELRFSALTLIEASTIHCPNLRRVMVGFCWWYERTTPDAGWSLKRDDRIDLITFDDKIRGDDDVLLS